MHELKPLARLASILVAGATLAVATHLGQVAAAPIGTRPVATEYGAKVDGHGFFLAPNLDPRNTPSSLAVTNDGAVWFRETFAWHPRIARFAPDGSFAEFPDPYSGAGLGGNTGPCVAAPSCVTFESWDFSPLVAAGNDVLIGPMHVNPMRILSMNARGDLAYRDASGCLSAGPDFACFPKSRVDIVFRTRYIGMRSGPSITISPNSAVLGPDGNIWFTDTADSLIGRIHPDGSYDTFTKGLSRWASGPQFITVGPDGNLWFTEQRDRIGRITLDGKISEFSAGIPKRSSMGGIVAGPDGNLWFTLFHGMVLARFASDATVTQFHDLVYPSDGHNFDPVAMLVRDRNGRLYYNEGQAGRIARVTIARP